MPHQVDQKALSEIQVIEDFLVISREAPVQSKFMNPTDNSHIARSSLFDANVARLADSYI
jgi:hypothetical protein